MTILRTETEKDAIREAGSILREAFRLLEEKVVPGATTIEIDEIMEDFIRAKGGDPAFKGYKGYPSTICASVNDVVVHGIPSESVVLAEGDIVGIDVGVQKNGFFADAARTYSVGKVSGIAQKLLEATRNCLDEGLKQAFDGNRVSDISNAVQMAAERSGFKEVRSFVGHGIGRALHEPPEVPNWGPRGKGAVLREGLVLAVEPMINMGSRDVRVLDDGWTAVTVDGKLSAHFEETIIIGKEKAEIIT